MSVFKEQSSYALQSNYRSISLT